MRVRLKTVEGDIVTEGRFKCIGEPPEVVIWEELVFLHSAREYDAVNDEMVQTYGEAASVHRLSRDEAIPETIHPDLLLDD